MNVIKAENLLLDEKLPMKKRMRALFYLRNIITDDSVENIIRVFNDPSVLLKHEAAYVLGQMGLQSAKNTLINILENENENEIVRHEAGEALGNFVNENDILDCLKKHLQDNSIPVKETCYLAIEKHKESKITGKNIHFKSKFDSSDPAYPLDGDFITVKNIFLCQTECLYKRYKAMFTLRDFNTPESVDALGKGFKDESALFKHEIAFVFGQMRCETSIKYLEHVLRDTKEHDMVRHEAAEALGAIGSEKAAVILNEFLHDPSDVVRESVEVALDIHDYMIGDEMEYAEI